MKTIIAKLSIIAMLATLSAHVLTAERHQSTTPPQTESMPVVTGSMYGEVMNNLFTASWR